MSENTRALVTKDVSKEITIRAIENEVPKKDLIGLLAIMPKPELTKLVKKYLTSKKRGTAD